MLHLTSLRRALAATVLTITPAAAMIPPAPLSDAMQAVVGDYTLTLWHGGSCPLTLHTAWADGGHEVYAQAGIDAECLAKNFGALNLTEPLQWTLFEGGGILMKAGGVELRFRPNYDQGHYVANPTPAGGEPLSLQLERIRP